MIIPIDKKWRIKADALSWMIQKKTKYDPPNDWNTIGYYTELKFVIPALLELSLRESRISSIQGIVRHLNKISVRLEEAIKKAGLGVSPGNPKQKEAAKKAAKIRKTRAKKGKK